MLHRLDAAFFQLGDASCALLVKVLGGETPPVETLCEGFRRNHLETDRLEAERWFCWSPAGDPARERDRVLRRRLADAKQDGSGVWASFDWTREVDLETMLAQQDELAALVDAARLAVKTAAVEAAADDLSPATLRQAQAFRRDLVRRPDAQPRDPAAGALTPLTRGQVGGERRAATRMIGIEARDPCSLR